MNTLVNEVNMLSALWETEITKFRHYDYLWNHLLKKFGCLEGHLRIPPDIAFSRDSVWRNLSLPVRNACISLQIEIKY